MGYSIRQAAEYIGVAPIRLSHWERDIRRPSVENLVKLAVLYRVMIDELCSELRKETVQPIVSNQKMNAYLKEVADLCGITKTLTFHIARHTFATTVTLTNGVPIETVSKMLGHKSIKITQHYAKIIDKKVSEDMLVLQVRLQNSILPINSSLKLVIIWEGFIICVTGTIVPGEYISINLSLYFCYPILRRNLITIS